MEEAAGVESADGDEKTKENSQSVAASVVDLMFPKVASIKLLTPVG